MAGYKTGFESDTYASGRIAGGKLH